MPYKEIRSKDTTKFYEKLNEMEKEGWTLVGYNLTLGAIKVGIVHKVRESKEDQ